MVDLFSAESSLSDLVNLRFVPVESVLRIKSELMPTAKHLTRRHGAQCFLLNLVISQLESNRQTGKS